MSAAELLVCELGTVDYRGALALQERVRGARQAGRIADTLLLLEHPPVLTRGRRSAAGELSMGEAWYREQGIDVVDTDRGGRVTYHGPGQLVGYPIMAIGDVIAYLRTMEDAIVAALADAGVSARARPDDGPDFTGVWAGERKIASIGVHVARGVTTHGFAINVDNDLAPFGWIVPCGLAGVQMTSVAQETGTGPALPAVRASAARRFAEAFERRPRRISAADLDAVVGGVPSTAAPEPSRAGPG
jgi:lipoyl(octanoyl) transferase